MTHAHIEFKAEPSEEEAVLEALADIGEPKPLPLEFLDAMKHTKETSPTRLRFLYEKWSKHWGAE